MDGFLSAWVWPLVFAFSFFFAWPALSEPSLEAAIFREAVSGTTILNEYKTSLVEGTISVDPMITFDRYSASALVTASITSIPEFGDVELKAHAEASSNPYSAADVSANAAATFEFRVVPGPLAPPGLVPVDVNVSASTDLIYTASGPTTTILDPYLKSASAVFFYGSYLDGEIEGLGYCVKRHQNLVHWRH